MNSPPRWQVRLYGRFNLTSPEGEQVVLPLRRAEALLSVLIVKGRNGATREDLAAILWPNANTAKSKASLRQVLSLIRRACPHLLAADGPRCRLAESIHLESDYDNPSLRSGQIFMPGAEGDWFDAQRCGDEPVAAVSEKLIVDGFLQLLLWLGDNDPSKMVALMRGSLALMDGINHVDTRRVTEKLPSLGKFLGWKHYFMGRLALGGNLRISEHHMKAAIHEALGNADQDLLAYALRDMLTLSVLSNKLGEARSILQRLSDLGPNRKCQVAAPTIYFGKAIIALHSGAQSAGLQYLIQAQDASEGAIEAASTESLRAFFSSTFGHYDEAEERLRVPSRMAKQLGHSFLSQSCELTRTNLMVKGAPEDGLIDSLKLVTDRVDRLESTHFKIYLKESIGLRLFQSGDLRRASRTAAEVRKLRRGLAMQYTPWDEMRLTVS